MLTSAVLQMVGFCTRHPWPVILITAVLAVSSALYTATHFTINTDTDQLLPKDLPSRQHELAYRDAFPQDQILAVVHKGRREHSADPGKTATDAEYSRANEVHIVRGA